MATARRTGLYNDSSQLSSDGRELFEACRNGDLNKVKKLLTTYNVNARDKAGRKSSPLHFAAGMLMFPNRGPKCGQIFVSVCLQQDVKQCCGATKLDCTHWAGCPPAQ